MQRGQEPSTSRRRIAAAALVVLVALVAAACGGDDDGGSGAPADGDGSASAGAFPVTVETVFGPVTVEEEPQRVVALGWSDAETALALGVQPVAATDWLDFGGEGVGPWAEGRYDEAPEILPTEVSVEAVAALRPDLILNTHSAADEDLHELLSQIAPTVGVPEGGGAWNTPWREQVAIVAEALGRSEQGDELVADVEARFAEARGANPGFEGREVAVAAFFDGQYGAYVGIDGRVRFMEELGFTNDPDVEALDTGSFYAEVSREQLDLLDADLTVVFPLAAAEVSTIEGDPLLTGIPSAEDGRLVVLDDDTLIAAFSASSALSLQYAVDELVPRVADALGGDE